MFFISLIKPILKKIYLKVPVQMKVCFVVLCFLLERMKKKEKKTKNYARKKIWAMYNQLSNSKARFDFFLSGIKERILIVNVGVKRYRTIDIGTIVFSNGS